ncbi:YceD family protein [Caldibacillus thermolactis]|jgi:uncharacterized protein|uniref:YceD family protein n=1 Tax=Pallidibacillus thermolactis TaxID=251051 RepID=A0ABT2WH73_9BACI|nr:YceD family protein [Pallidibacillus thermolactis]MCU9595045.1 YceD family protein [Pallidibacillus thermolactis]MCU9600362.1 YceD family protein [Pallidibacillus thermolactis subsp. kokeshiiformis]MED1672220.1 YceD family protein [Pallidibacillus thermolactis subsp. kokeshiiformis]
MKWSMTQLQKFKNKGLTFDEKVNLDSVRLRDPQIRSISPVRVKGTADIHAKEVTFHLHISGEMILPNSRTWEDVSYPFSIQTTEVFRDEISDVEEYADDNVHVVQGGKIDLTPIIEELILLEIPIQVYGDEDEEIPASLLSGNDWQFVQEEEKNNEQKVDPRLAKLAKLLNQEND